jgi:hypothetical protein
LSAHGFILEPALALSVEVEQQAYVYGGSADRIVEQNSIEAVRADRQGLGSREDGRCLGIANREFIIAGGEPLGYDSGPGGKCHGRGGTG